MQRKQPLLQRCIWAYPAMPWDTFSGAEPTEWPLKGGRKQSGMEGTSQSLPRHLIPTGLKLLHVKQEATWGSCCWRKGDGKERRAWFTTSGQLLQHNPSEGHDLTKQTVLIIQKPDCSKGQKWMFLQKTEEHYRFALNLKKKVLSDTEVTAKGITVGRK